MSGMTKHKQDGMQLFTLLQKNGKFFYYHKITASFNFIVDWDAVDWVYYAIRGIEGLDD